MAEAIVAGHLCLDLIPTLGEGAAALLPGRLYHAERCILSTGGAVSNTGQALHTLGLDVRLMGKVGDDAFGGIVGDLLAAREPRLREGLVVGAGELTSYSVVLNIPGRDRTFLHAPGCNDTFTADDLPEKALGQAKLLHFGYPPLMRRMYENGGEELERLLRKAKEAGMTVSLDLSVPDPASDAGRADWRAILARALPWVDLFFPSAEELLFMLRRSDFDRLFATGDVLAGLRDESLFGLAGEALDFGAKLVALKAGERGLFVRSAARLDGLGRGAPQDVAAWEGLRLQAGCYPVQVVGTTGSGDATIAGFLFGWLRGFSPERTLQAATAVGACCCEAADAVSGIRPWPEVEQRLAAWS